MAGSNSCSLPGFASERLKNSSMLSRVGFALNYEFHYMLLGFGAG